MKRRIVALFIAALFVVPAAAQAEPASPIEPLPNPPGLTCTFPYCSKVVGGVRIRQKLQAVGGSTRICTAGDELPLEGLPEEEQVEGEGRQYFILTASHCLIAAKRGYNWRMTRPNNTQCSLGHRVTALGDVGLALDSGLLYGESCPYLPNTIEVWGQEPTVPGCVYPKACGYDPLGVVEVDRIEPPTVGEIVCSIGATTGTKCGPVVHITQSGGIYFEAETQPGDSGSMVVAPDGPGKVIGIAFHTLRLSWEGKRVRGAQNLGLQLERLGLELP